MSSSRRGFILPTSLLVLTLLTVMLTAAFVMISAEYRSTDNSLAGTRALALAQAGMQSYFAANRGLVSNYSYDSVRYTYTGGYVDVIGRKMSGASSGITPWVIKAIGTSTDPLLTGQVTARRVIGQMALLSPAANIMPRAAMTALNGVNIGGGGAPYNPLNGANFNGSFGGCTAPAGNLDNDTAVITPSYAGSNPTGGKLVMGMSATYDSTHIDWASILAGNITPDYTTAAGIPAQGNSTWTVGFINGDVTLPSNTTFQPRQGILIVTGNVTISNNAYWAGLIIAGGRVWDSTATTYSIQGAVMSGLNCSTTMNCGSIAMTSLRKSTMSFPDYREIHWSYCYTNLAFQALGSMAPLKNTFIDNWAAY